MIFVGLKKTLFVFGITLMVISFSMFGASYAWYAYSSAETTLSGSTIDQTPAVIFAQDNYILANSNMPILDIDRYNYSNINSFNVTFGSNLMKYETAITILLTDINISEELKNVNYKYELLENEKTISTGNFSMIGDNHEIVLVPSKIIDVATYPTTYVYDLLIWLSDDGTDQNYLMNKTFSAKIKVNSAMKRK